MFKINKLEMLGVDGDQFTYEFNNGINYFKGKNNSGKTEFYSFIDYMFGSSEDIRKKPWYSGSLEKATMIIEVSGIVYKISRTRNPNKNYLCYSYEDETDVIDLREYKEKLNAIFAQDIEILKEIRSFTEEELTYRSFTMFNFLGEKRQGVIHDFLDKCSDVRYSVKLSPILNFIFNRNLEKIYELQKELKNLIEEAKNLEAASARYDFIYKQVNINLQKLGNNVWYTGSNAEDIKKYINEVKNMGNIIKHKKEKNIAELEVMYNNISEQIKLYENRIDDSKQIQKDNENRMLLLEKLNSLLEGNNDFEYLIKPLKNIISELDTTISFNTEKVVRLANDSMPFRAGQ
ncbi:AAA family ATPase [Paenibacillus lautus]|uniref:AAA family ATPase n=1 Tax=Paenibacillus lautus TaxID=1401 RepID=UPI001C7CC40C|nr:AAA family ATPase [Paenibacillus lautus]MBX4147278.1 AAA family ATPase [Paenibacillus lautus]